MLHVDLLKRFNRPAPVSHSRKANVERDAKMVAMWKAAPNARPLAETFNISQGRVCQIVERALRREGHALFTDDEAAFLRAGRSWYASSWLMGYYRAAAKGKTHRTLDEAKALLLWERAAKDVAEAQAEDPFADIIAWRGREAERQQQAANRAKLAAFEAETERAYERIRAIKAEWLGLVPDHKAASKPFYAAKVDIQLGLLRALGVEPYA